MGQYDGNISALDAHESDRDRWLDRRPICDVCGEPIQEDHYFELDGERTCPRCMQETLESWRVWID